MILLHSESLEPRNFADARQCPPYAILSHTWESDGEVSYDDIIRQPLSSQRLGESAGIDKILNCARQARKDNLEYFWIDTCCIQKTSSAELSEAINSMFTWYKNASTCYAYLVDVPPRMSKSSFQRTALLEDQWLPVFRESRWFKRGWTLQELIAPQRFFFFSDSWTFVGTKSELAKTISNTTKIPRSVLIECDTFGQSVACRMSWMSGRETTRIEDMAYCLLGIFNINMPLLYGEGIFAFHRLQQEIVKVTDDETIFAWKAFSSTVSTWRSLFAHHPHEFANSGNLVPHRRHASFNHETTMNQNLRIQLPLVARNTEEDGWNSGTEYLAILSCHAETEASRSPIGIFVKRVFADDYVRVDVDKYTAVSHHTFSSKSFEEKTRISVRQRLDYEPWRGCITCFRIRGMLIKNTSRSGAQLRDVQPNRLWDSKNNILTFNERDMRIGSLQQVTCTFSTGSQQSSVLLSFNPQAAYEESCCEYRIGSKGSFHAYHIRSHIRLINHEALLIIAIEAW